ncbi:MAG: FkbM family methyltransferase [Lactobacillaceae bacterium]|nr:FkbM family methyltransferase [Lactobacillaceae bacterium]
MAQQISVVEKNVRTEQRERIYLGNNRALTRLLWGQKIIVDTEDLSLSPHILLDGYWERWISEVFLKAIKPGMHVIDIGSNLGYYSLLAGRLLGAKGRLTCFEANPVMADITLRNLDINGFGGISEVISKAVYKEESTLPFTILKRHKGSSGLFVGSSEIQNVFHESSEKILVPTVSLDQFFPSGTRIDVIKVDAEGAEPYIFEGAQRLLKENNVQVFMEFDPGIIKDYSIEKFLQMLKTLQFNAYEILEDSSLQYLDENSLKNGARRDLLLKKQNG